MNRNIKKIGIGAVVLLTLAAGVCLPLLVSAVQDGQALNRKTVTAVEPIRYENSSGLSILKKMSLLRNSTLTHIESGMKMSVDEAKAQAISNLKKLDADGLLLFDWGTAVLDYFEPTFCINSADPSNSVIVWGFSFIDGYGNTLELTLDDESGMLLSLSLTFGDKALSDGDNTDYFAQLPKCGDALVAELANYYGITVSNKRDNGDASSETGEAKTAGEEGAYAQKWYELMLESGWTTYDFRLLSLSDGTVSTEAVLELAEETVSFR